MTLINLVGEADRLQQVHEADNLSIGHDFSLAKGARITAQYVQIGNQVQIGENVVLECDKLLLGHQVEIKAGTVIKGSNIVIGEQSTIMEDNHIIAADLFQLGRCSTFGRSCNAVCRVIEIGDFYHGGSEIDFGGGGRLGPNSIFRMGNYGFLGDRSIVNTSDTITIGDDVGIGAEVMLWTHGAYLSVLDGFPADFAPLSIGSHVWIPARSVILPGVTIGSNVVISIGSLINRDIPDGVLVGGIPAKVIRENYYPKKLSAEQQDQLVRQILVDYAPLLQYKGYLVHFEQKSEHVLVMMINESHQIIYSDRVQELEPFIDTTRATILIYFQEDDGCVVPAGSVHFRLDTMQVAGEMDELSEDLRDYLRRKGIKLYTKRKFSSIIPPSFQRWL